MRNACAALALVAGVALELPAQNGAVITGTVGNGVNGTPVANATVTATRGRRSYLTGGDGTYRLIVDAGESMVRVTAVGFAPDSQAVSLTNGASMVVSFVLQPSAVPLDEVVALGTRALERTATASTVPIDVISSQLMENTGMIETWQQLQRLVPSVNAPHIPLADNGMRPITLRGLSPHHALVLVNGKRRHPAATLLAGPSVPSAAFTDVNAIPSSAIDHIEVLRDGATAQYGSDAIGGVVNVVLKSGKRRDLSTSLGQVYSTEGGRTFHDGRLLDVDGTFGLASENGASLTLTGEFRDRGGTNRAYPDKRQQYFAGDARNTAEPRVSSCSGNGRTTDVNVLFTAASPLGSATELYVFGGARDKHNLAYDAFFRRPLDRNTVRAIFPDGFLPEIESRIRDLSGFAGVRGSLRGWRWDVSSGWGGNRVTYHVDNSNNVSLGASSPTGFYTGRISAQQWTSNLDVSRDLKVRSFPVTVAGGVELRVDKYRIGAGDSASWQDGGARILDGPQAGQLPAAGAQGMLGFRPIDEVSVSRSNTGIYLEAEARPSQWLLVQSAVRAEHYSDFGSTSDGKLSARMELLNGIAARASVSSGFRAPALTQQYLTRTGISSQQRNGVNTLLQVRTLPVTTAEAKLMGAVPLRPEKSVNRSAGLVVNKSSLPLITADYYDIKIDDRMALGSPISDTSITRLFEEGGMRGIGGGHYFTNSLDTRTRGVDLIVSHAFLVARAGVLRILGGYNHTRTQVTRVAPPPPQLAKFGSVLFNRGLLGTFERGQPRQTVTLGVNYNAGRLGLNLHNQRSGPTAQLDQLNPAADQHVNAKWITDLRLSYQLRTRLQASVSAANVFDVYPTDWDDFKNGLNAQGMSIQGIFRYPAALSPFGMNGRTLYLQLAYR